MRQSSPSASIDSSADQTVKVSGKNFDEADFNENKLTLVPAGPLGETVLEQCLDLDAPMQYREIRIDHGDEIAVRGVWRREATPTAVALGGYRVAPFLPTLSGAFAIQP